jgi:hypothetical protein
MKSRFSPLGSSALRSVALLYHYDQIWTLNDNNNPITLNFTNLELIVHTSFQNGSINSLNSKNEDQISVINDGQSLIISIE